MARTQKRALPSGLVSPKAALVFGSVLLVCGLAIFFYFINWYATGLTVAAVYMYVVIYGLAKRKTVHSTLIGSLPGAAPPAIGYLAVTGHIDIATILLFLAIGLWQMPHFYAIAMYRYRDYKAAGLPVMTVKKGPAAVRQLIPFYIIGFGASMISLTLFAGAGYLYLAGSIGLTVYWVYKGLLKGDGLNDEAWGKRLFLSSLTINVAWCVLTAFGSRLP